MAGAETVSTGISEAIRKHSDTMEIYPRRQRPNNRWSHLHALGALIYLADINGVPHCDIVLCRKYKRFSGRPVDRSLQVPNEPWLACRRRRKRGPLWRLRGGQRWGYAANSCDA